MARGAIGVSMGGSIEYRYQLKPTTRDCRNCKNCKILEPPSFRGRSSILCAKFHIPITDTSNAKNCVGYENKNSRNSGKR